MVRRVLLLLAAAGALGALLAGPAIASGAGAAEAQDRVGAFEQLAGERAAGRSSDLPAKRQGPAASSARIASAYLVAANKADALPRMAGGSTAVANKAAALQVRAGRNRVSIETPTGRLSIDLAGRSHYEKSLGRYVDTPHVKFDTRHVGPGGKVSYTSGSVGDATHADLRIVDRYLSRSGR